MRAGIVVSCVALVVAATTTAVAPARTGDAGVSLVASYEPPADDPAGAAVRGRGWSYDSAITAAALVRSGELHAAGALLDRLQELQRHDGALESSYDLATGAGAGPLRSGNQAWVGLAALAWRAQACSGRHDRLVGGVARWLLDQRIRDSTSPGFGLVRGGPDVSWASTEHNLEARAFFAALATAAGDGGTGPCAPRFTDREAERAAAMAGDVTAQLDRAIGAELLADDGDGRVSFRQGLADDAQPVDVQALGILWLLGHDRRADALAVARHADATMWVDGRTVAWPGGEGGTFSGYRPFADAWGPDVLWMEGTLQMRLAKRRLGADTAELDRSVARWAALTAPAPPLHADRATGEYHAWPAAAPAAWMTLSERGFPLLG